ncbi:hypothetical protein CLF_107468 [Clonorchis sinensis]|uniref:Uncharacterized protein n=1 Tax=Clonorchis sinensis TaxID=79923 RepID=G7YQM0_CLOSI|nr:hypothetical protein CLF_107468 [Clonorchis sinensis]
MIGANGLVIELDPGRLVQLQRQDPVLRKVTTALLNGRSIWNGEGDKQLETFQSHFDRLEIGELWSVDAMGPFPVTTSGNQYIVIMTEHLSRWIEAAAVPNQRATTISGVPTTGKSPFMLMYGRYPRLPVDQEIGLWPTTRLSPEELDEERREAQENLTAVQKRTRQKTASTKGTIIPHRSEGQVEGSSESWKEWIGVAEAGQSMARSVCRYRPPGERLYNSRLSGIKKTYTIKSRWQKEKQEIDERRRLLRGSWFGD